MERVGYRREEFPGHAVSGNEGQMENVEAEEEDEVDEAWAHAQMEIVNRNWIEAVASHVHIWRALKALTEDASDARRVIISVKQENGSRAWQKLHQRFGLSVVSRQGSVLADGGIF